MSCLPVTKAAVSGAQERTLREGLAHERELFARFLEHDHAGEGYTAFVEKRRPVWSDADVRHLC